VLCQHLGGAPLSAIVSAFQIMRAFLIALLFPLPSLAASFDCEKAHTAIERIVCSDQVLSYYDERLDHEYKRRLGEASDKAPIIAEQKSWLTQVRNGCKEVACIVAAYFHRLEELREGLEGSEEYMTSSAPVAVVCDPKRQLMLVRDRSETDLEFFFAREYQLHKVAWGDLLIEGPRAPSDDFTYRAGSRTRVQRCGPFAAAIEHGFLNANPMGQNGAESFPVVTLRWNGKVIAGPLRMARCPEGIWPHCPEDYAIAVIALEGSGARHPDIVIERYWEDHDYNVRSRVDVQPPR
jgi:uncharacterized protein YecT (DUF1311 family)